MGGKHQIQSTARRTCTHTNGRGCCPDCDQNTCTAKAFEGLLRKGSYAQILYALFVSLWECYSDFVPSVCSILSDVFFCFLLFLFLINYSLNIYIHINRRWTPTTKLFERKEGGSTKHTKLSKRVHQWSRSSSSRRSWTNMRTCTAPFTVLYPSLSSSSLSSSSSSRSFRFRFFFFLLSKFQTQKPRLHNYKHECNMQRKNKELNIFIDDQYRIRLCLRYEAYRK